MQWRSQARYVQLPLYVQRLLQVFRGYTPEFPGVEKFNGPLCIRRSGLTTSTMQISVSSYRSGATAVTLVPAMTDKAAHVTMLQRSPTYIVSLPAKTVFANFLRSVLPSKVAYGMTRWKNVLLGMVFYKFSRSRPQTIKNMILKGVRKELARLRCEHAFHAKLQPMGPTHLLGS